MVRQDGTRRSTARGPGGADLDLAIGGGSTHFYGVFGHDEAYSTSPDEDWRADTLEITRDILTSRYTVETQLWRGRPCRTRVRTIGAYDRSLVQLDAPRGLVPLPRSALRSTYRELDYGCSAEPGS